MAKYQVQHFIQMDIYSSLEDHNLCAVTTAIKLQYVNYIAITDRQRTHYLHLQ